MKPLNPYKKFTPKEWYLKNGHRVNQNRLTKYDVNLLKRLVGTNEQLNEAILRRLYYPPLEEIVQAQQESSSEAGLPAPQAWSTSGHSQRVDCSTCTDPPRPP